MWYKEYKDYPIDQPLKKYPVFPGKGIIGCEMHELNGWGQEYNLPKKPKKPGFIRRILTSFSHDKT